MSATIQERRPIRLRHVRTATAAELAVLPADKALHASYGVYYVLGRAFIAEAAGVNGRAGWVSGTFELRLLEEGKFSIVLPNDAGADGIDHADRFAVIADPRYEAGDEWIEVWDAVTPGLSPEGPLFVGTPTDAQLSDASIELTGFDALELEKTVHETAAGFWTHAPRDVFEAYTHAWVPDFVETFSVDSTAALPLPADVVALELRQDGPNGGVSVADGRLVTKSESNHVGATIVETADPIFWPTLAGSPDGLTTEDKIKAGFRVESVLWIDATTGAVGITTPLFNCLWGLAKTSWVDAGSDAVSGWLVRANLFPDMATHAWRLDWEVGSTLGQPRVSQTIEDPSRIALAIEVRDRWVYCYANGQLGAVFPRWDDSLVPVYLRIANQSNAASNGPPYYLTTVEVEHWLVRSRRPFLLRGSDRGSYRLPGEPQPGGLVGSYFDDRDLVAAFGQTGRIPHTLKPGREPVARRIDVGVGPGTIATLPSGVPADNYSVRWTGAIYLNLADRDLGIRLTGLDDGARVWVGKTRLGEEKLSDWNSGGSRTVGTGSSMRTHLGVSENGWYPIVIEYFNGTSVAGIRLEYVTRNADGSLQTWVGVPPSVLSPQGIYEASVRGDSHFEQLQEMGRTFGYQWTLEPRSLESGLFPGELVPRVRVGFDTDRIITADDLTDGKPTRSLAAREVVQGLILDAAGIAADGAQLSVEQLDFDELGRHLLIHEDAVSLSDITIPEVLKARGRTLQTLRSRALEEVSFRPRGSSELVDLFPLAGALTRLAWTPGLGVRVRFPRLRIDDAAPRQLIAVQRSITPAAIGPPEVSFRPRPRSQRAALRSLSRSFASTQRQYQGQVSAVPGNIASAPATAALPDDASRVPWPMDDAAVVGATLVVHTKTDASAWEIVINNVGTNIDVTAAGRVDVSGFVRRDGGNARCYVRLSGGTGSAQFQLELKVRI